MGNQDLAKHLQRYGVGHRGFADPLFLEDKPPQRLGVYDEDEESLCHQVITTSCHIPGCNFSSDTILGFEAHYNASHRFRCEQCRKNLPSAHLLDLHIQEAHDSFFAVLVTRKPCYACFIEECKDKFNNPEERTEHCIIIHKLPKDFRFDIPSKLRSKKNAQKMDVEVPGSHKSKGDKSVKSVKLANSKVKMFPSTIKRDGNLASGSKPKDSDKMEE